MIVRTYVEESSLSGQFGRIFTAFIASTFYSQVELTEKSIRALIVGPSLACFFFSQAI